MKNVIKAAALAAAWLSVIALAAPAAVSAGSGPVETAHLTYAPEVPPPIARKTPAVVRVELQTKELELPLMEGFGSPVTYRFWTFNGRVPGPFIRVRQGDTLEIALSNDKGNTMPHNIDLHAVTGPGGGAALTLAQPGETKTARFKMLQPGLFVYHCAAPPVTDHIANGMYGVILVEPSEGLPKVDEEYYVMQSEIYTKEEFGTEGLNTYDPQKAAAEAPTYVVFNGRPGSLVDDNALKAKVGDKVRIYFGNIGPNKISSFHVIGAIFDKVYREGGISDAADSHIQTTLVPAGGAAIVELQVQVPGTYSLVDHSIFRMNIGAAGQLKVTGPAAPDIYQAMP